MNNLEDYYKTIKELEDISINNEQIKNNLKIEKEKRKKLFNEVYKLKSDIETQRTITESSNNMSAVSFGSGSLHVSLALIQIIYLPEVSQGLLS